MSRSASLSAPRNRCHHLRKVVRLSAREIHPTTSMRQIPKYRNYYHEMLILSGTERTKTAHDDAQSRVDIFHTKTPNQCHTMRSPQLRTEEHEISVAPAQVPSAAGFCGLCTYKAPPLMRIPTHHSPPRSFTNLFPLFSGHRHTRAVITMRSNSSHVTVHRRIQQTSRHRPPFPSTDRIAHDDLSPAFG